MLTWCHMFNSTLISSARVWFDKLPPKSIDNNEMLWKAFLGNFSQHKKYIKDPVEIHHIKQREGKSTEAFTERIKAKSMHVNDAPECMRISGFMHGITNPDLIKKLNDNIPESVDEMMNVITAFLRGEVAAANHSRKKIQPTRQDRFTPLTKTLKEILAIKTRTSSANFEVIKVIVRMNVYLRMQIKEAVRSGQLSYLVKEIKQGGKRGEHAKATTKEETPNKEKAAMIFMSNDGQENPIVIEARVEGHLIYRMYIDRGSASEEGIVTIRINTIIPAECRMVAGAPNKPSPQEPTATEGIKVAIHPEYPE
ncbi:reverse transcriptase domain-containing protein [Tanacetum coccineum]